VENSGRLFEDKQQNERIGHVTAKIWKTGSTDQRLETSISKHAGTEKNVTTEDELLDLLKHEGQKQTQRPIRQISTKSGLLQCSIVHIIHCDFRLKSLSSSNTRVVYCC